MELTEKQIQVARQVKNQYLRDWRKKNKKRCQEYSIKYWLKKAVEMGIVDDGDVNFN